MTKLDELLQIDGVMAAGEFAPDGSNHRLSRKPRIC